MIHAANVCTKKSVNKYCSRPRQFIRQLRTFFGSLPSFYGNLLQYFFIQFFLP